MEISNNPNTHLVRSVAKEIDFKGNTLVDLHPELQTKNSDVYQATDEADFMKRFQESVVAFKEHFVVPVNVTSDAAISMQDELQKLQANINEARPSINASSWDFTLKDNQLQIVNKGLSDADSGWLQNQLDQHSSLKADAQKIINAASDYFEPGVTRGFKFSVPRYDLTSIKEQLNGKVSFKQLVEDGQRNSTEENFNSAFDSLRAYINLGPDMKKLNLMVADMQASYGTR